MGEGTNISWADSTFNPWVGCEKVSPGCANCYAKDLVEGRMARAGTWGADGVRQRTAESTWKAPLRYERNAERFASENGGRRQRVFCASLADVFEPRPELDSWRLELFSLIWDTPSLDWLLLTKRPEEARDYLRWLYERPMVLALSNRQQQLGEGSEWVTRDGLGWGVFPNVWIGTSIENSRFTWRADVLREIPAAVRFISAEPLLGSLFEHASAECPGCGGFCPPSDRRRGYCAVCAINPPGLEPTFKSKRPLDLTGIDWVIVGGESGGRDARPMGIAWARELRDACLCHALSDPESMEIACRSEDWQRIALASGARPAFLFKQFGSHGESGDYVGAAPTSGGHVLDGREWHEAPESLLAPVAA